MLRINPALSWYVISFIFCFIVFANILLSFKFMRDWSIALPIGLWVFVVFGLRAMLASQNELGHVSSSSIF